MDRIGPVWLRNEPNMDWVVRNGFGYKPMWVGSVRIDVLNGSTHAIIQIHSTLVVHSFSKGIRPLTLTIGELLREKLCTSS